MLQRISVIGITGTAYSWLNSFITERTLSINIPPHTTKPHMITIDNGVVVPLQYLCDHQRRLVSGIGTRTSHLQYIHHSTINIHVHVPATISYIRR